MMNLESKPTVLNGKDFIGHSAKIYTQIGFNGTYYKYLITVNNGIGSVDYSALSTKYYDIGDDATITDFDGAYYIL